MTEPTPLTDEQLANRLALADRLNHAADIAIGGNNPYGNLMQSAGLVLSSLVGHIRLDVTSALHEPAEPR